MAKQEFSFDIVSEVSMPEVANAVDQARREISQRYDFKDTGTGLTQDDQLIEVRSSTEDRLKAAVDVLKERAVKRDISLKALSFGPIQPAAKGTVRQSINVNVGLSDEKAKELVKFIKGLKVKVQSQIQGDQVRVTGKAKDDLQQVIQAVKAEDFGVALQFTNFRP
ncbi:MAG TPA: YajQ family cyclic di-GMP-binding protein [Actinomycetota bacterium]|jgi:cyclic-di-GMP-binding protein|nr:YajQ family cyclic di-GMP-binding protein [Actinomycetota bacterium]